MAEHEKERQQEAADSVEYFESESFAPVRRRLPDTRNSITHKFSIEGTEGYLNVGYFDDGKPAELFLKVAKEGSTLGGLMDCVGVLTSLLLQHGVELSTIADKLKDTRFEPSGFTKSSIVKEATSLPDYIFRWLDHVFDEDANLPE